MTTRINTNVSSLVAQNRLGRTNNDLQTALTRLSTGLRINSGKDDPAGLIASEALRSDITGINKAISNTQRATQIIATADSALGQVSSLLNDIRGLVVEAANSGALSDDEIAANQLQIDSSLEAINRIAQTTSFQGRKLLDGSLDFTTSAGANFGKLSGLQIDQANLGATGAVAVDITIQTAATQAKVDLTGIAPSTALENASTDVNLSHAVAQASGTVTLNTTTTNSTFILTAKAGGQAEGAEGNGAKNIVIVDAGPFGAESATYDAGSNTLTVTQDLTINPSVGHLASIINAGPDFSVGTITGAGNIVTPTNTGTGTLGGGRDAGSSTIKVSSSTAGSAANGKTVTFTEDTTISGNIAASLDSSGNVAVKLNGNVTSAQIVAAINGLSGYSASVTSAIGDQSYDTVLDTPPPASALSGGADASGGITQDAVISLNGKIGSEVFNFKAGTSVAMIADAVNLVKDATGVEAQINGTTLQLKSSEFGSSAHISIEVISEASGGSISSALGGLSQKRMSGTDLVATVNGVSAKGDGNTLSINTATLDLKTTVASNFTGTISTTITGGGALFQLGSDVVSNQQARLGLGSLSTAKLGGVNGRLFELGSGQDRALATDVTGAGKIIDEVISKVTSLRGRLGAFQRTTLESNQNSLSDTVGNLTEAESSIRDADFAAESARLTRAQILVQSGTQVLQIANQNPQNVLSLLR